MDFIVGTSAGVFQGKSRTAAAGVGSRGVRHLARSGELVFAGAQDGVYRSADGGHSWTSTGVGVGEVWSVATDPHDNRTLYASTQPAHLFVTHDSGDSWTEVESFLKAPGANTWCVPNNPLGARALALAFDPFSTTRFWVGVEVGGVVATDDGGTRWSVTQPRPPFVLTIPAMPDVRSSVKDPGGAQAVLYRSDDDGATWRSLGDAEHSPSAVRLTAVTPDPEQPGWVLVGTETGEVWRVRPDAQWTQLSKDLPAVQALLAVA